MLVVSDGAQARGLAALTAGVFTGAAATALFLLLYVPGCGCL
ncbi:hypothetical protein [Streptomyces sp. NPDC048188]